MDISFKSGNEKFNYRVCAMMISDGKILAMHDERSPYYYLPGGRVEIGETAENAVIREVQEELSVTPRQTHVFCFKLSPCASAGFFWFCVYSLFKIVQQTNLVS